jgi:hypothetical protein
MTLPTFAIQPDNQLLMSGRYQSFSERWVELAANAGIQTRLVDVREGDLYPQLEGCDGFMWWFAHLPKIRQVGRRVLPAIEHGLKILTFPNWQTIWHFDDKVAQKYLLDAAGIPQPQTWIFWEKEKALAFCRTAKYPMVLKLAGGIVSENVRRVSTADEAEYWIIKLFDAGITSLEEAPQPSGLRKIRHRLGAARRAMLGRTYNQMSSRSELQRGYVLLQEFVPGNEYDTRITVIGDRAFAFRRFNRPGDFRASGSGKIDWDHTQIDPRAVTLAFQVAKHLGTQSLAVDILRNPDGSLVMNEISYYYEGWAVGSCPGHWTPGGEWRPGPIPPEDAIFEDFVSRVAGQLGRQVASL